MYVYIDLITVGIYQYYFEITSFNNRSSITAMLFESELYQTETVGKVNTSNVNYLLYEIINYF